MAGFHRIVTEILKIGKKANTSAIQVLFDNGHATPCGFRVAASANEIEIRTNGGAWEKPAVDAVTKNVTTNTSLASTDKKKIIIVRTLTAAITLTLPTPVDGLEFTIKDADGNAAVNNITVARAASEKIEGLASSFIAASNWGSWRFFSNGTDWFII